MNDLWEHNCGSKNLIGEIHTFPDISIFYFYRCVYFFYMYASRCRNSITFELIGIETSALQHSVAMAVILPNIFANRKVSFLFHFLKKHANQNKKLHTNYNLKALSKLGGKKIDSKKSNS